MSGAPSDKRSGLSFVIVIRPLFVNIYRFTCNAQMAASLPYVACDRTPKKTLPLLRRPRNRPRSKQQFLPLLLACPLPSNVFFLCRSLRPTECTSHYAKLQSTNHHPTNSETEFDIIISASCWKWPRPVTEMCQFKRWWGQLGLLNVLRVTHTPSEIKGRGWHQHMSGGKGGRKQLSELLR
jgi:hypothetical protein